MKNVFTMSNRATAVFSNSTRGALGWNTGRHRLRSSVSTEARDTHIPNQRRLSDTQHTQTLCKKICILKPTKQTTENAEN